METEQQWLERTLAEYKKDNIGTLTDLLTRQIEVVDQFLKSPKSKAALSLLEQSNKLITKVLNQLEIPS